MLQLDACQDREHWRNDVGGIEPSAKPTFEHRKLHGLPREMRAGRRGEHVKPCGAAAGCVRGKGCFACVQGNPKGGGQARVRDRLPIHGDALVHTLHMGRSIESDPEPGPTQTLRD